MLWFYKEFGKLNRPLKMYKQAIQEIHACQLQIGCQTNYIESLKKQTKEDDKIIKRIFTLWVLSGACFMSVIIFIINLFIKYAN